MKYLTIRHTCFYAFIFCVFLTAASYYFQYVMHLEPCPLCIVQRGAVILLALCFLWGMCLRAKISVRVNAIVIMLLASIGIISAARKLWLQHYSPPEAMLICGPDLNYMLHELPFAQIWRLLLQGEGACARIDWQLMGLSMSAWTLAFFILFMVLALVNFFRA